MSNTSDEMEVVVEWASSSPLHALVAACEHDAVVVSVDGLVCAANERLAARVGAHTATQLNNMPLASLLAKQCPQPTAAEPLKAASSRWEALQGMLDGPFGAAADEADGVAASHTPAAREEAARKLIANHEMVVRDVTNPNPETQPQLTRVDISAAPYVDQMLREVARRLLGRREGSEEKLDASMLPVQAVAWAGTARYLRQRTQATPEERPGRKPDMSEAAAAAFRAVLEEVGGVPTSAQWEALRQLLDGSAAPTDAYGVASVHPHAAREEAARKLITNHEAVVRDVTNPNPKTQRQLTRVSEAAAPHVDQMLREVARRLLGRRPGVEQLQQDVDATTAMQTARFLRGRIQCTHDEKPGRHPDMSEAAAAAMRAVLAEVGGIEVCPRWDALRQLMDGSPAPVVVDAAATQLMGGSADEAAEALRHCHRARLEAARKLITNHDAVVRDVTNPNPKTQTQLARVSEAAAPYVDQMLREVARRLLGRREGSAELEEKLDASVLPVQVEAWMGTSRFLDGRIQASIEMPGRTPDMSVPAAAALRLVLREVGEGLPEGALSSVGAMMEMVRAAIGGALAAAAPRWEALRRVLDGPGGTASTDEAEGVANAHARDAREEVARKLITNHEAVVRDVTNPNPKTQRQLTRVSEAAAPYVDQMLREVARRLLGRREGSAELEEEKLDASVLPVQVEAWEGTARYMRHRTQATPDHQPGRKPDMSEAAAAAFRAVLEEVGGVPSTPFDDLLLAGAQGRASITPRVEITWRSGRRDVLGVRVSPVYDPHSGAMHHLLVSFFTERATMLTHGLGVAKLSSPDATDDAAQSDPPQADDAAQPTEADVDMDAAASAPAEPIEGLRNVSSAAQELLHAPDAPTTAWAVVFASALQQSMFQTVLLTRPVASAGGVDGMDGGVGGGGGSAGGVGVAAGAAGADDAYEIWHASRGLEGMLGVTPGALLGRDCTSLMAAAMSRAAPPEALELHRAVASRAAGLVETVLTTSSGAPLFCLAYVMPLHCASAARRGTVAVAFLDVHRVLPVMQKQMELDGHADCDLYTFVKFSLLNCLITDPSFPSPSPARRNPIVFASQGFCAMSGATTEECLGRNCRFLQQKYMGLRGAQRAAEAPPQTAAQLEAIAHMSAALDARQESLTLLTNFRADGHRFNNLLFMTPIAQDANGPRADGGVLFWVGVQHPVDEAIVENVSAATMSAATATTAPTAATAATTAAAAVGVAEQRAQIQLLRSCRESLQALQLQGLYATANAAPNVQRTTIAIHSADREGHGHPAGGGLSRAGCAAPGCASCATIVCRLCESSVVADAMANHTQICRVVSQCRTIVEHADATLARVLCKLNAAASSAVYSNSAHGTLGQLLEVLRAFASAVLAATAASAVLSQLSALPARLEALTAAVLPRAAALCWADLKAAGQRKLAALQHAALWTSELIGTIVPRAPSGFGADEVDPLSGGGLTPCLADFQVVRRLGAGSHASVHMVRKIQTGDVFAMKVLEKGRARAHRLDTERKVLFACDSPFVIRTFFAFEDPARLYLVMECLHSDCKQLIQRLGVIPERQAICLTADLVLALEHMHGCGVFHRDLKPENLLLTHEGRAKLADFGLSKLDASRATGGPKTAGATAAPDADVASDPSIVGTPFYMAPEVIRGRMRGLEAAADWWSCGVMLYEFLTGFPPFQGTKVAEIYRSILSLHFVAPIERCNVAPQAAGLVLRLLVLDPRERLTGAARVKSHPLFRTVHWPSHAQPDLQLAGGGGGAAVPTAQSLAAQDGSSPLVRATSTSSVASADTAATVRVPPGASAGAGADAVATSWRGHGKRSSNDVCIGSKSSDGGSSVAHSDGGSSVLSAASTRHFDAGLELQLSSEKTDANVDNLSRLNNDEAIRWAAPRDSGRFG